MSNDNDQTNTVAMLRAALAPFADESIFAGPQHDYVTVARSACDAAKAALDATSAPAQPVAVKVKPLVWGRPRRGFMASTGGIGEAYIFAVQPNGQYECIKGLHWTPRFENSDDAKAAAQADYEARILAALDVQPVTVQDAARVVAEAINSDMLTFNKALASIMATPEMPAQHFFSEAILAYAAALTAIAEGQA